MQLKDLPLSDLRVIQEYAFELSVALNTDAEEKKKWDDRLVLVEKEIAERIEKVFEK